jgi:hypothetical protein
MTERGVVIVGAGLAAANMAANLDDRSDPRP